MGEEKLVTAVRFIVFIAFLYALVHCSYIQYLCLPYCFVAFFSTFRYY